MLMFLHNRASAGRRCDRVRFRSHGRSLRLILLGLCVVATMLRAADDVGDDAQNAAELVVNAAAVTRVVNTDCDGDWFAFRTYPRGVYTIVASTGTVWDCTADLYASDGTNLLFVTNTAWTGGPISLQYTNTGAAAKMFVRVSGLLEFTTGTYSVAVSGALVDADADGMADAWEQQYLGGTNAAPSGDADGDGTSNLQEYLAGTHPNSDQSWFGITNIDIQASTVRVSWPAEGGGVYVLERSDRLYPTNQSWATVIVWRQGMTDGSAMVADHSSGTTSVFYRVRLEY